MRLTDSDGERLVRLARNAVSAYLEAGVRITAPSGLGDMFDQKARVFVTILAVMPSEGDGHHELRGCIGYLEARLPLSEATINAGISAATADPRFSPMKSHELGRVIFEVNVLTDLAKVKASNRTTYPSLIKIGEDGLVIAKGEFRGLLLPEVPVEWDWSPEEFLSQCCLKAGLYPDAWLDPDTKVSKFQSETFREAEPLGHVKRVSLTRRIPSRL